MEHWINYSQSVFVLLDFSHVFKYTYTVLPIKFYSRGTWFRFCRSFFLSCFLSFYFFLPCFLSFFCLLFLFCFLLFLLFWWYKSPSRKETKRKHDNETKTTRTERKTTILGYQQQNMEETSSQVQLFIFVSFFDSPDSPVVAPEDGVLGRIRGILCLQPPLPPPPRKKILRRFLL